MISNGRSPLVYTWLLLLAATLGGGWLGAENDSGSHASGFSIALAVLAIALLKCRLVIRNYMDVRFAPRWLRLTCDAWLVCNFAMISSFYGSG